jgi:hypothetical protein
MAEEGERKKSKPLTFAGKYLIIGDRIVPYTYPHVTCINHLLCFI